MKHQDLNALISQVLRLLGKIQYKQFWNHKTLVRLLSDFAAAGR